MKTLSILITFLIVALNSVKAHVELDYPVGGEILQPGQKVSIKWHISIPHNQENWDLYFSSDGGVNWESIALDIQDSKMEYEWIIPDIVTETGQVKVVMDNASVDYEEVSQNFSIRLNYLGFGDNLSETFLNSFFIYPNPLQESGYYSFILLEKKQILMDLYSVTGSKLLTIMNMELSPGSYTGNWNTSDLSDGIYLLRVRVGDISETHVIVVNK
jgi:hypothetical protein